MRRIKEELCSALADTESSYSNIERECLAVMFGVEKFEYYLLGRHTLVETDHLPLEQIFKKNITEAPARLQRFLLRCTKFDIEVRYRRGDTIPVADAFSRVCKTKEVIEVGNQRETCAPEYSIQTYRHLMPYRHWIGEVSFSEGPNHAIVEENNI